MFGMDNINLSIGGYFIIAAMLGVFGFLAYVIISREWFDKENNEE